MSQGADPFELLNVRCNTFRGERTMPVAVFAGEDGIEAGRWSPAAAAAQKAACDNMRKKQPFVRGLDPLTATPGTVALYVEGGKGQRGLTRLTESFWRTTAPPSMPSRAAWPPGRVLMHISFCCGGKWG